MRGVNIPEELTDEPLEGLPFVELFYKFMKGIGYSYQRQSTFSEGCKYRPIKRTRAEILANIFNLPIC